MQLPFGPLDLCFAQAAKKPFSPQQIHFLAHLFAQAREGHLCVDCGKVAPFDHPWVRFENDRAYLLRHYNLEKSLLAEWERVKKGKGETLPFTPCPALNTLQNQGVKNALQSPLSIICGGPGTGKTTVAAKIIELCGGEHSIVAAPTGKAVSNLKQKLSEGVLVATLHSLLSQNKKRENPFLKAKLVVIDECSMIDAVLFDRLLKSIPDGVRVVFVGDPHQLPSVEPGSIFADFVAKEKELVTELKEVHRTEFKELIASAQAIKEGKRALVQSKCVRLQPLPSRKELVEHILSQEDVQWLSPLRQGPYGVDALNELCYKAHQQQEGKERRIPILVAANDKRTSLCNGDVGVIYQGKATINKESYSLSLLPKYEYSYVLSVHKSQGSEYKKVAVLLPEGSEKLGRAMLYTAITRATEEVSLFGEKGIIEQIIQNGQKRFSGIG